MNSKVPDVFKDQDTIYHYTSLNTAIDYILKKKQLRFSPRLASNDPIEFVMRPTRMGGVYWGENHMQEVEIRTADNANEISLRLKKKFKQAKQLCFCENESHEKFKERIHNLPEEYFGFLKPRMWDQYGDKYNGVCLSFSKRKLLKIHTGFSQKVEYLPYSKMYKDESIRLNELDDLGFDEYNDRIFQEVVTNLSKKHIDYSGESEFRLYSFSDENYDYINISEALNGIILPKRSSSKSSAEELTEFSKLKEQLDLFSKEMKIEMLYLKWQSDGVLTETLKESERVHKIVMNNLEAYKPT